MQGGTELAFMSTTESIDVAVSSRIESLDHTCVGQPMSYCHRTSSIFPLDHINMAVGLLILNGVWSSSSIIQVLKYYSVDHFITDF